MRTGGVLVLGAVLGAAAAWLWGRSIADYVGATTRGARATAAEGIRAVDEKTGKVLDYGESSLRRAEEFVHEAKEHVGEALRAGQEAIRPSPATRDA